MAKIAMLLPHPDMLEAAVHAANLYHLELSTLAVVEYGAAASYAKAAVSNGADIIVARGGQAVLFAETVDIPVVEIKLTTYEIGLLIEEAKRLSPKDHPFIALTGPDNMFVNIDASVFEQRYSVRFSSYLFHGYQSMTETAQTAIDDGADVLIGGPDVFRHCQDRQIPCVRTFSGREGIIEACRVAKFVASALEQEKSYSASLNMLLDHTYSGIIQVDSHGLVIRANQFVEHLLFADSQTMEGRPVWDLIPGITRKMLENVFGKRKELLSVTIRHGRSDFIVSISPILVDESVSGAIISFHEGIYRKPQEEQRQKELIRQGHTARHTFQTMITRSPQMQQLCARARHYGSFHFPVLLLGPSGTEKQILAECIHNSGPYKDLPFIRFNCNAFSPEEAGRLLFQPPSGAEDAESHAPGLLYGGPCTLYLHEISALSRHTQYQLLSYIQNIPASVGSPGTLHSRHQVQIILSSRHDLLELAGRGLFRQDLYYAVSTAVLKLPPLRERREDIMGWIDYQLKGLQENYGRYIRLTKDAQKFLESYDWPGNLLELRTLCNRIMVNCRQYYVDASQIEQQLDKPAAPISASSMTTSSSMMTSSPSGAPSDARKAAVQQALKSHGGNREQAAARLGISTTTLWRWMKKYRIPKDFGK